MGNDTMPLSWRKMDKVEAKNHLGKINQVSNPSPEIR